MGVNDGETEQYGALVVSFFFAYSRIVYVTRMNTIYSLSMYRYFQSDNERERR